MLKTSQMGSYSEPDKKLMETGAKKDKKMKCKHNSVDGSYKRV